MSVQLDIIIAIAAERPEFAEVRERVFSKFAEQCIGDVEVRRHVYEKLIRPMLPQCVSVIVSGGGICREVVDCVYSKARAELEEWFRRGAVRHVEYYAYGQALKNIRTCVEKSADKCDLHIYYEVANAIGVQQLIALRNLFLSEKP